MRNVAQHHTLAITIKRDTLPRLVFCLCPLDLGHDPRIAQMSSSSYSASFLSNHSRSIRMPAGEIGHFISNQSSAISPPVPRLIADR